MLLFYQLSNVFLKKKKTLLVCKHKEKKRIIFLLMSVDKKLTSLIEKKNKIDDQIQTLKLKNTQMLATALSKITDIEKLDNDLIVGAVLKIVKNIPEDEKEVLRNSGKTFLKKCRLLPVNKTGTKKE